MNIRQSRRNLLISTIKGGLALATTSVLSPILLSSCKRKEKASEAINAKEVLASLCPGQESLSEEDKMVRKSLKYVDQTPQADKTCDNCKLYTNPRGDGPCGGCQVVPGPIHPKGYCSAWIRRM